MQTPESYQYVMNAAVGGTAIGWEPIKVGTAGNAVQDGADQAGTTRALLYAYNLTLDTGDIQLMAAQNSAATILAGDLSLDVNACLYAFDGVDFARLQSIVGNSDNITPPTAGLLGSAAFLLGYDAAGNNWDRCRLGGDNTDGNAAAATGHLFTLSHAFTFNGTTWDRGRSQSATNAGLAQQIGAILAASPATWSVTNTPAANTQATITRASGGAGIRHIVTSISARLIADAGSASNTVQVNLRDGATGAGTILWSETLKVGGAASVTAENAEIKLSGLQIFGSAATAMTLEFSGAGGANTVESVAMTGYDVA